MSLRDDILAAKDTAPVFFACEWGHLYIRRFTGTQAAEWHLFATASMDDKGTIVYPDTFAAKLVQLSVVDQDNKLVFAPEDVPALVANKSSAIIAQIFAESSRVNCLTREEVAKARANFLPKNPTGTA